MLLTLHDEFSLMNDTEAATKDVTRMELAWEEVSPEWSGGGSTRPERRRHARKSIHPALREKRTSLCGTDGRARYVARKPDWRARTRQEAELGAPEAGRRPGVCG